MGRGLGTNWNLTMLPPSCSFMPSFILWTSTFNITRFCFFGKWLECVSRCLQQYCYSGHNFLQWWPEKNSRERVTQSAEFSSRACMWAPTIQQPMIQVSLLLVRVTYIISQRISSDIVTIWSLLIQVSCGAGFIRFVQWNVINMDT